MKHHIGHYTFVFAVRCGCVACAMLNPPSTVGGIALTAHPRHMTKSYHTSLSGRL